MNHDFKVGDLVTYKDSYKRAIQTTYSPFDKVSTEVRVIGIITQDDKKIGLLTVEWVKTDYDGYYIKSDYVYSDAIRVLEHIPL
jgi:hypothetical protein